MAGSSAWVVRIVAHSHSSPSKPAVWKIMGLHKVPIGKSLNTG